MRLFINVSDGGDIVFRLYRSNDKSLILSDSVGFTTDNISLDVMLRNMSSTWHEVEL